MFLIQGAEINFSVHLKKPIDFLIELNYNTFRYNKEDLNIMPRLTPEQALQVKPATPKQLAKITEAVDALNKKEEDRLRANQIDPSKIKLTRTQERLLEELDEEQGDVGRASQPEDIDDIPIGEDEHTDPIQIWQSLANVPTNRKVWLLDLKGKRYCGIFLRNEFGKAYFKYDGYSQKRHPTYWCDIPWALRRTPLQGGDIE